MKASPEFSRLIAVEGIIPDKIRTEQIAPTADECAALCKRFDLRALENVKATLKIRRVTGGAAVKVDGEFSADVVQACVVSLRDVHNRIEGRFETFFAEPSIAKDEADVLLEGDEIGLEDDEDAPEMIRNGMIDLGEVVAQYLYLEIDPYPRAPGVSLAAQMAKAGDTGKKANPFDVLQGLADKKDK
jgi:uncharacterized metal-binding protein YceD (DUF177 family)